MPGGWLRERPPRTLPGNFSPRPGRGPGKAGRANEAPAAGFPPPSRPARVVALGAPTLPPATRGRRWSSGRADPALPGNRYFRAGAPAADEAESADFFWAEVRMPGCTLPPPPFSLMKLELRVRKPFGH